MTHVVDNLDPECVALIRRAARRPTSLDQVTAARRLLLSEERDTFGLIAEIAGLGREANARGRRLIAPADEVDPGRAYLETVRLSYNDEEALSTADLGRFDGILGRPARRNARGMVIRHPTGNITVLNTNNKNLEHTKGCDLVYYHTGRKSGLVVQYKRMIKDSRDLTGSAPWVYRGDKQLTKELDRMRSTNVDTRNADVPGYRLNHQPHYLKIVRPTDYDGQSTELMKGLYLPLDLIDLMQASPTDTTDHGNLRITWDDKRWPTQRHMNNTTFTQLFRDGWIGSCGTTSDEIRRWIEPLFDADELVTVVIAENS